MSKNNYTSTAYQNLTDFVYGKALKPVSLKNGMVIGGGTVYPEINFTLPPMLVTKETMPEVIKNYKEIIEGICVRARELHVPGFVAEIETVPPCTENPDWGIEVCKVVVDTIKEHESKHGIKGSVRITPNDIREGNKLEHMWKGWHWEQMLKTFDGSAKAGADFMSVETVGGKETHDEGTMFCDIEKCIFALSVLGCTDMGKVWTEIGKIADKYGNVSAGDTACGFANTSMVLAEQNYIPRVFAAVDRVVTAVRSLVAFECGAEGPDKDCAYEGPYIKAITGCPISMEGKTSACAHLTSVGNAAMTLADIWSNESVQNIKLLGGMAPTCMFEMLVYDCRLMNEATKKGQAIMLRDLLAATDTPFDPTAYIMRPDVVLDISKGIVKANGHYGRCKEAAKLAVDALKKGCKDGDLKLNDKEAGWLDILGDTIAGMPSDVGEFTNKMLPQCEKLNPKFYDM